MKYWTTANGDKLLVSNMKSDHIKNCIAMLERNEIDPYDIHGYEEKYGDTSYTNACIEDFNKSLERKVTSLKKELNKRKS